MCQCLTTLRAKNFFLISNINLTSLNLTPLPLVLSLHALVKSPAPAFLIGTLQVLNGCNKVSPQPSVLQAEQPQLLQSALIGEVLQPSDHFCGRPLHPLSQVHVFAVLRAPELDAELR